MAMQCSAVQRSAVQCAHTQQCIARDSARRIVSGGRERAEKLAPRELPLLPVLPLLTVLLLLLLLLLLSVRLLSVAAIRAAVTLAEELSARRRRKAALDTARVQTRQQAESWLRQRRAALVSSEKGATNATAKSAADSTAHNALTARRGWPSKQRRDSRRGGAVLPAGGRAGGLELPTTPRDGCNKTRANAQGRGGRGRGGVGACGR